MAPIRYREINPFNNREYLVIKTECKCDCHTTTTFGHNMIDCCEDGFVYRRKPVVKLGTSLYKDLFIIIPKSFRDFAANNPFIPIKKLKP